MIDANTILFALFSFFIAAYFLKRKRQKLRGIPGPPGLPFLGNALQLDPRKPNAILYEWTTKYGGLFKINIVGEDVLVVSGVKEMREVFITKSEDFAGRPKIFRGSFFLDEFDIALTDISPQWSALKNSCMAGLRQAGEKVQKLEDLSMDVIDDLVNDLVSLQGQPVDLRDRLHATVAQMTFSLLHGRKLTDEEHKEYLYIDHNSILLTTPAGGGAELDVFPWLRFFPNKTFTKMKELKARMDKFMREHLQRTIDSYREGEVTCTVDGLLAEREKCLKDPKRPQISLGNIDSAMRDLAVGGTVTTSAALYYMVSLLATHSDIQQEAYNYIYKLIGHRRVTLKDRQTLPFIESLIFEMLRLMSHAPIGVPHKAMKDTSIQGHHIPKNTQIWMNMWFVHHDPQLWTHPWGFLPRRFLDAEGNLVLPDHPLRKQLSYTQLFIFGAGRRICAGEVMARNRLFLFVVTLIQRMKFHPVEGEGINTDPRSFLLGFALQPNNFKVQLELRTPSD